jgi:hypothetical protein
VSDFLLKSDCFIAWESESLDELVRLGIDDPRDAPLLLEPGLHQYYLPRFLLPKPPWR